MKMKIMIMSRVRSKAVWSLAVAGMLATGCSRGSSNGVTNPAPTPGNPSTTITISSTGVSPKAVAVSRGSQVTFANSDTQAHNMNSNPHPVHTDCPELNIGVINAGESRQTGILNTVRTCGYHDHNQSTNAALQGTITIQ